MTKTIKIVTYNIWHGTYLDKVIEFLRAEKPDVVCLQEVSTNGMGLQPAKDNIKEIISEHLGMECVYSPMYEREKNEGQYDVGVCIMSMYPIVSSDIFGYAGGFRFFNKTDDFYLHIPSVAISAHIETIPLPIITTHLPVTEKTKSTLRQQEAARELRSFTDNYQNFILCGDMNTLYRSPTYSILAEGLVDITRPKESTLHPRNHPVGHLGYHVDYIFYQSPRLTHLSTKVPIVDGSDHLPVVAEFEISST